MAHVSLRRAANRPVPLHGAAGAVIANAVSGILYLAGTVLTYLVRSEWRKRPGNHSQ